MCIRDRINSTRTHFEIQKGFSMLPGKSLITNFQNVLALSLIHILWDTGVYLQAVQRGLDAKDILAHIEEGPCGSAGQPAVLCLSLIHI